jgi:hypothetical protein
MIRSVSLVNIPAVIRSREVVACSGVIVIPSSVRDFVGSGGYCIRT